MGIDMQTKRDISSFELYLFDWDGTLNSMGVVHRSYENLQRAIKKWNKDSKLKDIEKSKKKLKEKAIEEERKNLLVAALFDVLLIFVRPKLHNDTIKLIQYLRDHGKKVAILSNGRGARLRKELKILGIEGMFDAVVSAKDIKAIKPDPYGIHYVARKLGCKTKDTLYIGDTSDDILTAFLAKVPSCAVANGFHSRRTLQSAQPDYIFSGLEEMLKALNAKGRKNAN